MTDSEFAYFVAALNMKFGYAIGISTWITLVRLVMVFVNTKLQEFAETALPSDKEWVNGLLQNRCYRITCFIINAVASVKLPTKIGKTGDTERLTRPQ